MQKQQHLDNDPMEFESQIIFILLARSCDAPLALLPDLVGGETGLNHASQAHDAVVPDRVELHKRGGDLEVGDLPDDGVLQLPLFPLQLHQFSLGNRHISRVRIEGPRQHAARRRRRTWLLEAMAFCWRLRFSRYLTASSTRAKRRPTVHAQKESLPHFFSSPAVADIHGSW